MNKVSQICSLENEWEKKKKKSLANEKKRMHQVQQVLEAVPVFLFEAVPLKAALLQRRRCLLLTAPRPRWCSTHTAEMLWCVMRCLPYSSLAHAKSSHAGAAANEGFDERDSGGSLGG